MQAIELRTDYLKDPIGLGDRTPEFFWKCAGGKKQTAYQILVTCEGKLLWNSGKVPKNSMTHIRYEGKELKSRNGKYCFGMRTTCRERVRRQCLKWVC